MRVRGCDGGVGVVLPLCPFSEEISLLPSLTLMIVTLGFRFHEVVRVHGERFWVH